MPSRPFVLAIIIFWLSTITWLIFREVVPHWRAGQGTPPSFVVELTDEVSNFASWDVLSQGQSIGSANSRVERLEDRTFRFHSEISFRANSSFFALIRKISCTSGVDDQGKLLNLDMQAKVQPSLDLRLAAKVDKGMLKPVLNLSGEIIELKPVELPANGSVLNPMQFGNRFAGLSVGQSWRVPMLNTGAMLPGAPRNFFPDELLAMVSAEELSWSNRTVPCFRIDFHQSGQGIVASMWARQTDGTVLQQQVKCMGLLDLLLIRIESKT